MNMKANIAGVEWKNPVTVASGTFGSGWKRRAAIDYRELQPGIVCRITKTCGVDIG